MTRLWVCTDLCNNLCMVNQCITIGDHAIYNGMEVVLGLFSGSANHTAVAIGHRCGDEFCRRFDIAPAHRGDITPYTVWECELTMISRPTRASADFREVGDRMVWVSNDGCTTVVVQRLDFAWSVRVERGGFRVEQRCGSYSTEQEARDIARVYAKLALIEASERAAEGAAQLAEANVISEPPATQLPAVTPDPRGIPASQLKMSPGQAKAIQHVMAHPNQNGELGVLGRGRGLGKLTTLQLRALARRGLVDLIGSGYRVTGARVRPPAVRLADRVLNPGTPATIYAKLTKK